MNAGTVDGSRPPQAAGARSQDEASAENYWRQILRGFRAPTPLLSVPPAPGSAAVTDPPVGSQSLRLGLPLIAALSTSFGISACSVAGSSRPPKVAVRSASTLNRQKLRNGP